jgi:oxygen-independent coproporphyrinogen III oxidase
MTASRRGPPHLYLHVPFCTRRCSYCDFAVEAVRTPPTDAWLDAVVGELELTRAERGWEAPLRLDTFYVGGGTPSLLGGEALGRVRERLAPLAALEEGAEWSCEANPESFTAEVAAGWRRAGVNRVSLGVQSFHEPALRWMGRLHGPEGPGRAVAAARAAGLEDLSVDLIFGLPAHLGRDWRGDLERALALEPQHVSLYGLTAEAGAPLGRWVREGRERLADEESYADEYLLAHELLTAAGFEHYEVSNFALPGRRSRHNLAYWSGAPYAALGPGAHSFDPPLRRWNLRGWDAYREAVSRGAAPLEGEERIGPGEERLERLWLGLRTDMGLPRDELSPAQRREAARWEGAAWAHAGGDRLRLTPSGWLLLDRLAVEMEAAAQETRSTG